MVLPIVQIFSLQWFEVSFKEIEFVLVFVFDAWEQMLKFTIFKRQEINFVFK
jgi:hypothetical protein